MTLTRDQILNADDLNRESVEIPEWNGSVLVRGLTAVERDAYEESLMETYRSGKRVEVKRNLANAKARLAVLCIIGDDGERLFADTDAPALGLKNAAAVDKVVDVIQRLSGLTDKDVEELEKNS